MSSAAYTLFPTAIGRCGVAWSADAVSATHLPEASDALTAERIGQRAGGASPGEPPSAVSQAISAMTALLAGERIDLAFIACDFTGVDPFRQQVYSMTRAIRPGETLTYGNIALKLGDRLLAQLVGQALGRNPLPIIVPCHRVMGAGGKLTGFSANGGVATKLRMLEIEGARMGDAPSLFGDLPLAVKPKR